MSDNIITARSLAPTWALVGATLPKVTITALDKLDAVRAVETPFPAISTDFDPKSAADAVDALARELAVSSQLALPNAPQPPRVQARYLIMDRLSREAIHAAAEAVPAAIDEITPAFDAVAEKYCDAVAELPDELSADALLTAGGAAYEAFHRAKDAASELAAFDAWVSSLLSLGVQGDFDPPTRITDPETEGDLRVLWNAHQSAGGVDATEHALGPVWLTAARIGVPFRLLGNSERVDTSTTFTRSVVRNGVAVRERVDA